MVLSIILFVLNMHLLEKESWFKHKVSLCFPIIFQFMLELFTGMRKDCITMLVPCHCMKLVMVAGVSR